MLLPQIKESRKMVFVKPTVFERSRHIEDELIKSREQNYNLNRQF